MTLTTRAVLAAVLPAVAAVTVSVAVLLVPPRSPLAAVDEGLRRYAAGDEAAAPGAIATVLDTGGRVRSGTSADPADLVRAADVELVPGAETVRTQRLDGQTFRVLTVGRPGGTVQVARPIDALLADAAGRERRVAAAAAAGLLAAALTAWPAQRLVLAPVRRVASRAEAVVEADEGGRLDPTGDVALDALVRSLNRILGQLGVSRAAQRALVADVSHELRTPLTAVRANLDLLTGPDRLALTGIGEMRAAVLSELRELARLVDDLVDLGRAGERPHRPAPVRLDLLAEEVVERYRRRFPGVAIELEAEPATVAGDSDRLERALDNLLGNAVKHGAGAPVTVTVDAGGAAVRDRGPGIAPEDLVRVFDRFWRGQRARGTPGSGLGLAITRQIAREHGGDVDVDLPPGGGARFRLRLPGLLDES